MLRVRSAGKGDSGRRDGGSQDEYRRKVPHVGGVLGAQGHDLRGIFKIRGLYRRVSVMDRGEIGVSGIPPKGYVLGPGGTPPGEGPLPG